MSKLQVLAVIFIFLSPAALFADQIVLKNGDRLTGSIEKSDNKTLVIRAVSVVLTRLCGLFRVDSIPQAVGRATSEL